MGKRRRAREMAIQMLYQNELGGSPIDEIFASFDLDSFLEDTEAAAEAEDHGGPSAVARAQAEESFRRARELVEGTLEQRRQIDEMIRNQADNWRLERMPAIDRNILRLAIFEMLSDQTVPRVVVVDEAIELAKRFGSEDSGRFVNGLLDGILNSRRLESAASPAADGSS
jgi:transcription antitermination protein NusB